MRAVIESYGDLVLVGILTLMAIAVMGLPEGNVLRAVLGTSLLMFLPGYVLVAALHPSRLRLSALETLALSLGSSIALVPLVGLALNFTSWGIRLESLVFSLVALTLLLSGLAWWRRRRLPDEEQAGTSIWSAAHAVAERLRSQFRREDRPRFLVPVAVTCVVVGLSLLGYVATLTVADKRPTEFYILGEDGTVQNYPSDIRLGESATVSIGVVNREGVVARYRVEVFMGEVKIGEVGPVDLADAETWQAPVTIAPLEVGEDQAVEFHLYKDGEPLSELPSLSLWVDVTE